MNQKAPTRVNKEDQNPWLYTQNKRSPKALDSYFSITLVINVY